MQDMHEVNRYDIPYRGCRSLLWSGDELIDWVSGGRRITLNKRVTQPLYNYAYRFDSKWGILDSMRDLGEWSFRPRYEFLETTNVQSIDALTHDQSGSNTKSQHYVGEFSFHVPNQPWSYIGELFQIVWLIEVDTDKWPRWFSGEPLKRSVGVWVRP